jgi:hypothetical protein
LIHLHVSECLYVSYFQDNDSDTHRGDGDVEGKSWAMDERLQSEMEEAERDADRSWYVLVFLMLGRMSVMLIIPDMF